jgi:hypothetical protein
MLVRQTLNEKSKVGIGVGVGLIVVAIGIIAFQLYANGPTFQKPPRTAFYTNDDGKTFFKDDYNKVVPFDHNGKQAYRADVFQCPDGKQFVAFVYRHTASGRQQMQEYISRNGMKDDADGSFRQGIENRGAEMKRPGGGDKAWRPCDDATVESLRNSVKCPSGGSAQLVIP